MPSTLSFDESETVEDNDSDLEEELLALTKSGPSKPPRKPKTSKVVPVANLDELVKDSMRDIPSDDDISDGDDSDIYLLEELRELTQNQIDREEEEAAAAATAAAKLPEQKAETSMEQLLEDRLKMYIAAEGNAKKAGETSRARRFGRGIKTLQGLIKDSNAGKAINPEDIPPEVAVTISHKPPVSSESSAVTEPSDSVLSKPSDSSEPHPVVTFKSAEDIVYIPPTSTSDFSDVSGPSLVASETTNKNLLGFLSLRRDQYKIAALEQKRAGNIPNAKENLKIVKQFEAILKAVENGEEVDLSGMPDAPRNLINHISTDESAGKLQLIGKSEPIGKSKPMDKTENETQNTAEENVLDEEEEQEEQLITASSILEALEQRLEVYKNQESSAKTEGISNKNSIKQFLY